MTAERKAGQTVSAKSEEAAGITIANVYLGRSSFAYTVNPIEREPSLEPGEHLLNFSQTGALSEARNAGLVTMTAETVPESTGVYTFSVEMVAVVLQAKVPVGEELSLEDYIVVSTASLLFPFVREHVAALTGKGRFGALWLPLRSFTPMTPFEKMERADKAEGSHP